MKALRNRLAALAGVRQRGIEQWRRVIPSVGQTRDEALDEYGRDKVGEKHGVIFRQIVQVSNANGGGGTMRKLDNRLSALERSRPDCARGPAHLVKAIEGQQTDDEAIDAYCRDRIGLNDGSPLSAGGNQ